MVKVDFVPGAVATPNPITIPAGMPGIDAVVSATITRLPVSLADHLQAAIVGALAVHAAHGHDITTVAAAGGGAALTEPAVAGPIETAAGPQVNVGAVDVLGAPQAHGPGANPVVHAGASPVVAAVPTRLSETTFSLDVNTLVGDVLTLTYVERGSRLSV